MGLNSGFKGLIKMHCTNVKIMD